MWSHPRDSPVTIGTKLRINYFAFAGLSVKSLDESPHGAACINKLSFFAAVLDAVTLRQQKTIAVAPNRQTSWTGRSVSVSRTLKCLIFHEWKIV